MVKEPLRLRHDVVRSYFLTVNERLAGVASFPAGSVARTGEVWLPSLSAVCVLPGPEQGPKAAVSIRHWKVEPASLEENPNVGVVSLVEPPGPETIVVGAG